MKKSLIITTKCGTCGKELQFKKYDYDRRGVIVDGEKKVFCSHRCSLVGHKHSEETKQKISTAQKGIPCPQRSQPGHLISEETKDKIRKTKLGVPSGRKGYVMPEEVRLKISQAKKGKTGIIPDWEIVKQEMSRRGVSKYVITKHPIPDAIWIEDGNLVALELEKKKTLFEVNRKMDEYENTDLTYHTYDKVYLVWYFSNGTRMKEWKFENGIWSE